MYISHNGLRAIHQEIVNGGVRRSEVRRLLKERKEHEQKTSRGGRASSPGLPLIGLIRSMFRMVAL